MVAKLAPRKKGKEWTALLDEMAALAVKARDGFRCRAYECRKHWQPVLMPSGRVVVAENCHWAHVFPRVRGLALRHEVDNGLTLCFAHHKAYDAMTVSEQYEWLIANGMTHEMYFNLQKRAREIVPDLDGCVRATNLLNYLHEALDGCECFGLDREDILDFFRGKMKE